MERIHLIHLLARSSIALLALATAPLVAGNSHTTIAFASCHKLGRPAPAFETMAHIRPDVFVWMGDIIYADTQDMELMASKYRKLHELPGYTELRKATTIIGTWDDHDYGANDVGQDYPKKAESQQLLLDFLEVPQADLRRSREGVYSSHTIGQGDKQVKIILLDTRYHRQAPGKNSDILGEAQWAWLEQELKDSDAAVNVLVSSIQVLSREHKWEKWANFPQAEQRLFQLLNQEAIPPVVILSGDRHFAELMLDDERTAYPLYELSSSSLNSSFGGLPDEVNGRRLGLNYSGNNFGLLSIDWDRGPILTGTIFSEDGTPARAITFTLKR